MFIFSGEQTGKRFKRGRPAVYKGLKASRYWIIKQQENRECVKELGKKGVLYYEEDNRYDSLRHLDIAQASCINHFLRLLGLGKYRKNLGLAKIEKEGVFSQSYGSASFVQHRKLYCRAGKGADFCLCFEC